MSRNRLMALLAVTAATGLISAVAGVLPAQASQSIDSFTVSTSNTEAGGHPDLSAALTLHEPGTPETAQQVTINEPAGFFANPNAITICTSSEFALTECPTTSQAGVITVRSKYSNSQSFLLGTAPVYEVTTQSSDEAARMAFVVPMVNISISIPVTVRTGSDYGLRLAVTGISQSIPLAGAELTIWGVPYATPHNVERFLKGRPGEPAGCPGEPDAFCASFGGTAPNPAGLEATPLLDNPTACTGEQLMATASVVTYQDPSHSVQAEAAYPPITECEKETFNPRAGIGLTTEAADTPSGLNLQLKSPQFENLTASPSEIRSATVVLPQGISVNPDAADGQHACTDAQAAFGSDGPSSCPDSSKIGNFDIETPALDGPLVGSLYFGEPKPGNQYRIFMIADGFGVHAKLFASVIPDPKTGQLTLIAENLPQVPFEAFNIHLFASDRGLVATPTFCNAYTAVATFTPWNESLPAQTSRSSVFINEGPNGSPCPGQVRPFQPHLVAGMSTPAAGAFSSFTLKLDREDGDQFLGDLNFRMPPGFTGSLRGIPYCSDAAISSAAERLGRLEQEDPSCPAASQIGTTNVAAGPGDHPFHAVGRMYLAGPFKGAPLSLAVVTPALAGPYDYGTIVVRVALHVDPLTAQVSAVSDTVPSIIGGVPIRMRSIGVEINRPNFTINPTNCSPFSVESQGIGDQGTVANFSSYFHAVNCYSLPFKPKMSVSMVGPKKAVRRSANPTLNFDLFTRPGDANIKSLSVTLPSAFEIDQNHLGNICTEKELAATQCAGRQSIGEATTTTPLLEQPLSGPVYAVSGSGGLPKLAFLLNGQVDLLPRGESRTLGSSGRLQTTVPVVPDAPVGHFHLHVFGGHQGYLQNTRDLCTHAPFVEVKFDAQNGRELTQRVKIKAPCGKGGKARPGQGKK